MSETVYENPIVKGTAPDPSLIRVGNDFYLATSTFNFLPGVTLRHSTDLVNWRIIGGAITRPSQYRRDGRPGGLMLFAPTLRYAEGTFYLVCTNVADDQGNFVVSSTDPTGEWSDAIWIDTDAFDPSLLYDDGTWYYTRRTLAPRADGRLGPVVQAEVNIETGELDDLRELTPGYGGFVTNDIEGPHLYHIGDWYYLFSAEGGSWKGHLQSCARSRSPWGPFESAPHNPVLTHRNRIGHPIQTLGHAELVDAPDGSWWAVALGTRHLAHGGFVSHHNLGRETFLMPVDWVDGWPVIGNGGTTELVVRPGRPLPGLGSLTHVPGAAVSSATDGAAVVRSKRADGVASIGFLANDATPSPTTHGGDRDHVTPAAPGFWRAGWNTIGLAPRELVATGFSERTGVDATVVDGTAAKGPEVSAAGTGAPVAAWRSQTIDSLTLPIGTDLSHNGAVDALGAVFLAQCEDAATFEATLEMVPDAPAAAGVAAYADEKHHFTLLVSALANGSRKARFTRLIDDLITENVIDLGTTGPVSLRITASAAQYTFAMCTTAPDGFAPRPAPADADEIERHARPCESDDIPLTGATRSADEWTEAGRASARLLSAETAEAFVGARFALLALHDNGAPAPAESPATGTETGKGTGTGTAVRFTSVTATSYSFTSFVDVGAPSGSSTCSSGSQ